MPVVDLRFMVHNKKDIVDATKSLKEFNVANVRRAANHDKVAAADLRGMKATNQLRRLTKTLQADLIRLEEEGILTQEELTAKGQEYNLMLAQRERELKNFVETDKVALAQAKREQKMVDESVKKTKRLADETEKLKRQYSSSYAALQKYKEAVKDINKAWGGDKTAQGRAALKALRKDYLDFTNALERGSIVDAGNQFARYGDQAYRATQKTKRFASVGLQQAGYQVNDFIVQVASGQNALVAFGQQGSQFAGIFGTGGAVVGAIIAGIAALGNLAYQMYNAEQSVEELSEAFSELGSQVSAIESMGDQLESVLKAPISVARNELAELLKEMKSIDLAKARKEISLTFGKQYQTKFNKLIGSKIPLFGKVVIQKEGILAEMQEVYESLSGNLKKQMGDDILELARALAAPITKEADLITLGEKLNDLTAGRNGKLQDQVRLFLQESGILDLMVDQQVELAEAQEEADKNQQKAQEKKEALALQMRKANLKHLDDQKRAEDKRRASMAKALEQAANEYRQVLKREEKAIANSKVRIEQQRIKLELQQAELEYGKGSSQYDKQRVISAKALARIAAEQKFIADGITDAEQEQIELLVEAAGEAETLSQALEDSKNNARDLEASLSSSVSALNSLMSLGDNIDKAIAVAEIRLGTLQITDDPKMAQIAATIEGYRQDITKFYEKAFEGLSAGTPEFQQLLDERFDANQKLYALEGYLELIEEENDRIKGLNKSGGKDKKSPGLIMTEELFAMKQKLDLQEASLGKSEKEILFEKNKSQLLSKITDQMVGMSEVDKAFYISQAEGAARYITNIQEQIKLMQEHEQHQKNVADTIANSMGDALTSIVDGTKSVSDAFKDMARAIIAELYQIYVVKQITGMISSAIFPNVPALPVPAANGNAFSNGNVVPYADGGVVSNDQLVPYANGGVVGGPTYFPMNDGRTGLMGEAGPEAIMPLKRGKNGKLGVQAEGGAGDVIIHQNFNFTANGDESVKQIIAQQAPAIANMTKKQIMDDRRRGGQMKQAFG